MAKTIAQLTELAATPDATDFVMISDNNVSKKISVANLTAATLGNTGTKTVAEGTNLALGTATGTKIGTATSQKLGFFNATPVVQPALTADLLDSLQSLGLIASGAGNTPLDLTSGTLTCGTLTPSSITSVSSPGAIASTSQTAGIGYATGAGSTATQGSGSGKSTGVTLSRVCGRITMDNAALAGNTTVGFVLTNTAIAATDVVIVNHVSGGTVGNYIVTAHPAAGSATINVRNITAGSLSDALVLNFAVIKAVTA